MGEKPSKETVEDIMNILHKDESPEGKELAKKVEEAFRKMLDKPQEV